MTIGLGILGCGGIARRAHIPSLARVAGARVVALADADSAALAAAHELAPAARSVTDLLDVLEMPDVDAVVICLPPALHAETAIAALERGKHVYIEKPVSGSVADVRRVVAAWEGSGLVAMPGFNYRRNPIVRSARETIAGGSLGAIVGVRTVFSTLPRSTPEWKSDRASGGGVLLDLAVHHIDLVRYLFDGEVAEVAATLRSVRTEDDTAFVQLRLTSGCDIQSFFSLSAVEDDRVELFGERARLTIDRYRSLRAGVVPSAAHGTLGHVMRELTREWLALPYALQKLRSPLHEPSFPAAMSAFVGAVRDRTVVRPDLHDALQALTVVEAAERSARSGRMESVGRGAGEPGPVLAAHVEGR